MAPCSNHPDGTGEGEQVAHRDVVQRIGVVGLGLLGARVPQPDLVMHSAFMKSVMLHVTVWTRAYVDDPGW